MALRKQRGNPSDKYLNFFTAAEVLASSTALQQWSYDTGISPRGGWIWEVYTIEMEMNPMGNVVAAAGLEAQEMAIGFVSETTMPSFATYGTLWSRTVRRIGQGTYNLQYWYEGNDRHMQFPRPLLYAKNIIYVHAKLGVAGTPGTALRIGYLTKATTGPLAWEVVEQYMAGI